MAFPTWNIFVFVPSTAIEIPDGITYVALAYFGLAMVFVGLDGSPKQVTEVLLCLFRDDDSGDEVRGYIICVSFQ